MSLLDVLPEEIVEKILLQVVKEPSGLAPRCAVLLTCRKWYRIALPLFYHTVYIKGEKQAGQLVATLEGSPVGFTLAHKAADNAQVGSFVRSLVISCPLSCPTLPRLVSQCTELTDLDICLDANTFGVRRHPMSPTCGISAPTAPSSSADAFLASLSSLETISNLTLRKDASVYLTLPKVGQFITRFAECVRRWNDLHSIYIAFRLSDDAASTTVLSEQSSSSPSAVRSPLTNLTHALAHSPRLESVTTHLPSVWNNVLTGLVGSGDTDPNGSDEEIKSSNLKKIVLLPGAGSPKPTATPSFSPRTSYTRPSYADHPMPTRTTIGVPVVPGHGLGLSLMPSSAPSPSTPVSLGPVKDRDAPPPLPANSLYLSTAARHHPKLMDLIRAGWQDAFSASALAGNTAWYGAGRGRAWTYAGE